MLVEALWVNETPEWMTHLSDGPKFLWSSVKCSCLCIFTKHFYGILLVTQNCNVEKKLFS